MFLELNYHMVSGPTGVMYATNIERQTLTLELGDGESSADRAMEAAAFLRQQVLDAGGPVLELREEYPPEPATEGDPLLDQFLAESPIPGRIMARWKHFNHLQRTKFAARFPDPANQPAPGTYDLDEDGWSPGDYASFAQTIGTVTILLYAQSFSDVVDLVQAHVHPVATPAAKQAYLAAMQAELPTPSPTHKPLEEQR